MNCFFCRHSCDSAESTDDWKRSVKSRSPGQRGLQDVYFRPPQYQPIVDGFVFVTVNQKGRTMQWSSLSRIVQTQRRLSDPRTGANGQEEPRLPIGLSCSSLEETVSQGYSGNNSMAIHNVKRYRSVYMYIFFRCSINHPVHTTLLSVTLFVCSMGWLDFMELIRFFMNVSPSILIWAIISRYVSLFRNIFMLHRPIL